jgi:hypothetical protein
MMIHYGWQDSQEVQACPEIHAGLGQLRGAGPGALGRLGWGVGCVGWLWPHAEVRGESKVWHLIFEI